MESLCVQTSTMHFSRSFAAHFDLTATTRRRDDYTTQASCGAEQNVVKPSRRRVVAVI
jgi:hypothetical protein